MRPLYKFTVRPLLPPELQPLRKLASNLMWCWDHELISLFSRVDPDLWIETLHNPIMMLGRVKQERLQELAADDSFTSQLRRAQQRLDDYMNRTSWYSKQYQRPCDGALIAYFSMEFGITESLQIYSGGLGILSGDLVADPRPCHTDVAGPVQPQRFGTGRRHRLQPQPAALGKQDHRDGLTVFLAHQSVNDLLHARQRKPAIVVRRQRGTPVRPVIARPS